MNTDIVNISAKRSELQTELDEINDLIKITKGKTALQSLNNTKSELEHQIALLDSQAIEIAKKNKKIKGGLMKIRMKNRLNEIKKENRQLKKQIRKINKKDANKFKKTKKIIKKKDIDKHYEEHVVIAEIYKRGTLYTKKLRKDFVYVLEIDKNNKRQQYFYLNDFLDQVKEYDKKYDFKNTIEKFLSAADIIIKICYTGAQAIDIDLGDIEIKSINAITIHNRFVTNYLRYNAISNEYDITNDMIMNSYILNNQQANACFYTLLINTYKEQFEKINKSSGCKKYNFEMTYESLFKLFNPEHENLIEDDLDKIMYNNLSLTFNKSLVFFKKFHINLRCC